MLHDFLEGIPSSFTTLIVDHCMLHILLCMTEQIGEMSSFQELRGVCLFLSPLASPAKSPQKSKQPRYELTRQQRAMIKKDTVNQKLWDEVLDYAKSNASVRPQQSFVGC